MSFLELMFLAVSLSMDAFAVAVCRGLALREMKQRDMWIVGLYFGLFQAIMPLLGWGVGQHFAEIMAKADGIVPTLVLGMIGLRMVEESRKPNEEEEKEESLPSAGVMLALAVATSIDAFAVGVTFVVLDIPILWAVTAIGVVTFFFSAMGVQIGHIFGLKYKTKAELLGGMMLLLMALRFLELPF